jgi:serine protease inhibitor
MRLHTLFLALLAAASGSPHAETATPSDASFGFELLKRISTERPSDNVIIAPHNIRTALAAVATGAEGETHQQIVALTGDYKSIGSPSLNSAQSAMDIWVAPVEKLLPSFAAGLPGVQVQSTSPESAPAVINDFVCRHTRGMIRQVVDKVDDTGIVLTAALYFKGVWQLPFDKKDTRSKPFHSLDGHTSNVDMMFQANDFAYAESASGQTIQLPYVGKDNLVLTVFLPKPKISLTNWLTTLDGASWHAMLRHLNSQSGSLQLPKLASSFSAVLNGDLQALGVQRPFADDAQFRGIVRKHRLKISEVTHRTVFDMDEVSTEASAATTVQMVVAAAPMDSQPPPFSMIIDRPFFLTVGDRSNDHILFAGVVNTL